MCLMQGLTKSVKGQNDIDKPELARNGGKIRWRCRSTSKIHINLHEYGGNQKCDQRSDYILSSQLTRLEPISRSQCNARSIWRVGGKSIGESNHARTSFYMHMYLALTCRRVSRSSAIPTQYYV